MGALVIAAVLVLALGGSAFAASQSTPAESGGGTPDDGQSSAPAAYTAPASVPADDAPADASGDAGGTPLPVNLTGYWPFQAGLSVAQQTMEGGPTDRKGHPLNTLETHKRGEADYVSLSGDYTLFAYGQKLNIPALGTRDDGGPVVGRIVDTGEHFSDTPPPHARHPERWHKVIRHAGHEPIDVCVEGSDSMSSIGAGGPTDATLVTGDKL